MKTILIPTNFTDVARHATDYAIQVYGPALSRIILLNAFEQPRMGRTIAISLVDILRKTAEKGLHEDKMRIEEEYPGLNCEIEERTAQGDLGSAIRSTLEQEKVDLIVMGSKGDREFVDFFVESVTAKVIKQVDHPMLIVPPIARFNGLNGIILTTDLKNISDETILKQMRDLCMLYETPVRVLHISKDKPEPSKKAEAMLSTMLYDLKVDFNYRKNVDIPSGIYKFIQESNADIVTLVKRKGAGNLVARLFHRSISHRIAKGVRQTLLLLTDQDAPVLI